MSITKVKCISFWVQTAIIILLAVFSGACSSFRSVELVNLSTDTITVTSDYPQYPVITKDADTIWHKIPDPIGFFNYPHTTNDSLNEQLIFLVAPGDHLRLAAHIGKSFKAIDIIDLRISKLTIKSSEQNYQATNKKQILELLYKPPTCYNKKHDKGRVADGKTAKAIIIR